MNPCPCGYYGDPVKQCKCSASEISRYQKRISGPLLDRIDIFIEVPRVEYEKLTDDSLGESSERVRTRIEAARQIQQRRFEGTKLTCNTEMTPIEVKEFCQIEAPAQSLLRNCHETASPYRSCLPPHPQASPDDCRPRRSRCHQGKPPG